MIASGMNLVMTLLGFIISSVFVISVCTRFVCTRISRRQHREDLRLNVELVSLVWDHSVLFKLGVVTLVLFAYERSSRPEDAESGIGNCN